MKKFFATILLFIAIHQVGMAQNVGIGTTSPNALLHLRYPTASTAINNPLLILDNPAGGVHTSLQFQLNGVETGRIRSSNDGTMTYSTAGNGNHVFRNTNDGNDLLVLSGTTGNLHINYADNFTGTLGSGALKFGGVGSGEGITSRRDGGDNNYGIDFYTSSSSRMSITNGGDIGIGTNAPAAKLDVLGNIRANNIQLSSGASNGYVLQSDASGNANWVSPYSIGLWNISDTNIYNNNGGYVGIGTSSPNAKLQVFGVGNLGTAAFGGTNIMSHFNLGDGSEDTYIRGGLNTSRVIINDASSGNTIIAAGASKVGIGTNSPSEKLDVNGKTRTTSFQMTSGAADGYLLQADASGNATWVSPAAYTVQAGTGLSFSGNTLNSNWTTNGSDIYNNNSGYVGINTNAPNAQLHIAGEGNDMLKMQSSSESGTWVKLENTSTGGNLYSIISTGIGNGEGSGKLLFNAPGGQMVFTQNGRLGIGQMSPAEKLDVNGKIKTTSFQMTSGAAPGYVLQTDADGNTSWVDANTLTITETDPKVSSSVANYVSKWNGTALTDGIIYDDGSKVGIGTSAPTEKLQVNGRTKTTYLQLTDGAGSGLLLKSDANGNASWVGASSAVLAGTGLSYSGSTLNSVWTQTGSYIFNNTADRTGIGTNAPNSKMEVASTDGNSLTISSTTTDATNLYLKNSSIGNSTIRWTGPSNSNGQQKLLFITPGNDATMTLDQFENRVGIGTVSPTTKLEVSGTTRTTDLQITSNASNGYILQSDASGLGTWTALNSAITAGTGLSWSGSTLNSAWTENSGDVYRTGGNVGIGTNLILAKLHVSSSANTVGLMESSSNTGTWHTLSNTSTGGTDWNLISTGSANSEGAGNLLFRGNGNVRMTLQSSSGNLGIGTTSPSARLHVFNATGSSSITVQSTNSNATVNINNAGSGYESAMALFSNSSQRWSFGKSNTAEGGSDAGSDFFINRYNDAGTFQSQPVVIKRNTGFMGINQGNPGQQLDVNGNINISSSNGYYIGSSKVLSITGSDNLFAGVSAGAANNTGSSNTFIGKTAGQSNTGGNDNTALGFAALNSNTTTSFNTALGSGAGVFSTGSNNVLVGYGAGVLSGSNNIMIGFSAGGTESGNNKLYIDNSNTSSPLIYGDFSKDSMSVNGSLHIDGAMGLRVKASQVAGTNNPNATGGIWIYASGSGTIDLTGAAYTDRVLIILNNTGATRTISSYRDLANTAQTTIANNISLWLVHDGTNWRQIK